jgi:hypothetical protein
MRAIMLRCPKCNREYSTDSQKFCTHDGGRLSPVAEAARDFNPNATVQGNFAQFKEMGSMPGPSTPPPVPLPPPDLNKTVMGAPIEPAEPTAKTVTDLAPTSKDLPSIPAEEIAPAPQVPSYEAPRELEEVETVWSMPAQPSSPEPPTDPRPPAPTLIDPPPSPEVLEPHAFELEESFATQVSPSVPTQVSQSFATQAPVPSNEPVPPPVPVESVPPIVPSAPPMPAGSPYASAAQAAKLEAMVAAPPKKNRRLGLIFAIVALLLLLFVGAVGVVGFLYWNNLQKNANGNSNTATNANSANSNSSNANTNTNVGGPANTNTNTNAPPPDTESFINTRTSLEGPLADHYADFAFNYPKTWQITPSAAGTTNFVELMNWSTGHQPVESFVVSFYESAGTLTADRASFDQWITAKSASFERGIVGYEKVSAGDTTINAIPGYEFRFRGKLNIDGKPDIWGRMVFLPPGSEGQKNGITLVMYATSLSPDIHNVDDLGVKGGLPVILNTFKYGH